MHCKEIESVLEHDRIESLPVEARAHVAGCVACQSLVADFNTIIAAAERMPAEIAPPERVWISLRAQLEAEGIIRHPALEPVRWQSAPWRAFEQFFRGRAFATAAVGIVIVLGALFQLQPTKTGGPTAPGALQPSDPFVSSAAALSEQEQDLANIQRVGTAAASPVDASLQKSLRELDEFIAECSRHLKEQPQDDLAREYLSTAYQQKAELLSAMIDRGRSVN